jgi:hypothetical protein
VVVIDLTWEMIASSVIIRPVSVATKLNVIVTICKYKRLHKGYHFIFMAMEVLNALAHDMDRFIREFAHLFHNRRSRRHLSMSFCIQFFKHCVSIAFQHALAFAIKKMIGLVSDACFRPPIMIRTHYLCACDIRRVVG